MDRDVNSGDASCTTTCSNISGRGSKTTGCADVETVAELSQFTICPPAIVVDEVSDFAFPGRIAPAVKV